MPPIDSMLSSFSVTIYTAPSMTKWGSTVPEGPLASCLTTGLGFTSILYQSCLSDLYLPSYIGCLHCSQSQGANRPSAPSLFRAMEPPGSSSEESSVAVCMMNLKEIGRGDRERDLTSTLICSGGEEFQTGMGHAEQLPSGTCDEVITGLFGPREAEGL